MSTTHWVKTRHGSGISRAGFDRETDAAVFFGEQCGALGLEKSRWASTDMLVAVGYPKGGDPLLDAVVTVTHDSA